jgi:hypothetical protein
MRLEVEPTCKRPVAPSASGEHVVYATFMRLWSPAATKAGLAGVTPHDLRHTWGSRLSANGLDVLMLSRLLGHSDVTITMRIYVHEMPGVPMPDRTRCSPEGGKRGQITAGHDRMHDYLGGPVNGSTTRHRIRWDVLGLYAVYSHARFP